MWRGDSRIGWLATQSPKRGLEEREHPLLPLPIKRIAFGGPPVGQVQRVIALVNSLWL